MGHYAKVVNGFVTQVIVAEQEFIDTFMNIDTETWVQTSYNTRAGIHYAANSDAPDNGVALRGNYAGIGYTYDQANDVFYAPQPFPSWTISAPNWTWIAPVAMPTVGRVYTWNEATQTWVVN